MKTLLVQLYIQSSYFYNSQRVKHHTMTCVQNELVEGVNFYHVTCECAWREREREGGREQSQHYRWSYVPCHSLSSQSPGLSFRLQQAQYISLTNRTFHISDNSPSIIQKLHTNLHPHHTAIHGEALSVNLTCVHCPCDPVRPIILIT